jgi:hypothetical protein
MRPYGPVLDCTGVLGKHEHHRDDENNEDKPVSCGDDRVEAGGRLFKVGINRAQRVFKATPTPSGTKFELVRVEMHGTD